jgi:hypothetical protein
LGIPSQAFDLFTVRRRVAELWRLAGAGVDAELTNCARLYRHLLGEVGALVIDRDLSSTAPREHLVVLIGKHRDARPRGRAEFVRGRLIFGARPSRSPRTRSPGRAPRRSQSTGVPKISCRFCATFS